MEIKQYMLTLNIGLNVAAHNAPNGKAFQLSVPSVLKHLEIRMSVHDVRTYRSNTEDTLVVVAQYGSTIPHRMRVQAIAGDLMQDAIAYTARELSEDEATGYVVGPRAEKWGEFNPAYFILMDGRTKAEADDATMHSNEDDDVEKAEQQRRDIAEENGEDPDAE